MAYTNPGSIIRFSSRKGGRASIYENNAQYQQHSTGVFSGSGATQNTSADMNIIVGGALGTSGSDGYIPAASPANPNVLIGKNANGYKIMLDVVGTTLLQITKPAQNSRISLVAAYTDDLSIQSTETSDTGNPAKNGIIVVNGQSLANPVPPSDSDIRTAITADGAAGSQAVYAIIARITVASNTTTITNTMIAVDNATIPAATVNIPHAFGTNAADINFQTGSTVGVAVASLTLATSSLVQINASCKVALSSNQETNIIIWDATTGTVLHSTGNASNANDVVRSESASIQVQLAAGKHDIQIQQTAFNGGAGTHRIPVKSATITAFAIG